MRNLIKNYTLGYSLGDLSKRLGNGTSSIVYRLLQGTFFVFILQAAGIALLFYINTWLGNHLGANGYGVFNYASVVANLLAAFVLLGWPTSYLRFIAQYQEQAQWALFRGIIRRGHQIVATTSVLTAAIVVVATYWLNGQLSKEMSTSIFFAGVMLPLVCLSQVRNHILRGMQKVLASVVLESIAIPLLFIVWLVIYPPNSAQVALTVFLIMSLIVFFFGSIYLSFSLPKQCGEVEAQYFTRKWILVALPLMFGSISQIVMNRTDTIMLGFMMEMDTVGIFSAASRIAALNIFVLAAINTVAAPMLASAYHGERPQQFAIILRNAMLGSIVLTLPILCLVLTMPQLLLGIFGEEFVEGTMLLRILAIGQFISAITGPVAYALMVSDQEVTFAKITGLTSIANILGNVWLIPLWGALGAAIVTALSTAVSNGLMFRAVWHSDSELSKWIQNSGE